MRLAAAGERSSILDDVAFTVAPGEVLGIVGESGSGKSVLALSVMGLLPPALRMSARHVTLFGHDLAGQAREAWRAHRGRDMAMIFQEPMTSLNPVMRVGAQIEEVLRWRGRVARGAARRQAILDCSSRSRSRRRRAGSRLSARAVRRHAPAGDDRDRPGRRPQAADRRRTHHRARRHRPGADPGAAARLAARVRAGADPDHP